MAVSGSGLTGSARARIVPSKKTVEYDVTPLSIASEFFLKVVKLEYICKYEEGGVHS